MYYINKYLYDVMTRLTQWPESDHISQHCLRLPSMLRTGTRNRKRNKAFNKRETTLSILSHSSLDSQTSLQINAVAKQHLLVIIDLRRTIEMVRHKIQRARPPEIQHHRFPKIG